MDDAIVESDVRVVWHKREKLRKKKEFSGKKEFNLP